MGRPSLGGLGSFVVFALVVTCAAGAQTSTSASEAVVSSTVTSSSTKSNAKPPENEESTLDPASLLPDLPSLPNRKASLIGGSVERVDRIRDQLTLRVFGGGKMKIFYDPRTHISAASGLASATDLQPGDRVYVDTILNGSDVFARNIRVAKAAAGSSQGVVVSYHPEKNVLLVRDQLSPEPVSIRVDSRTDIENKGKSAIASELVPGTLVDVVFTATKDGRNAQQVNILAVPGSNFTFAGQVISLDLRLGLLVLVSANDHKTYEIHLGPAVEGLDDRLRTGAVVNAVTTFDGTQYLAKRVSVTSP